MNYLGHLYFSCQDKNLMYHNLFGDFVKGKDLSMFPEQVQHGILLHRKMDNYIDNHPEIKKLNIYLSIDLPKIYSVAIDLYFDHYLAKNWWVHHEESLDVFLQNFYQFKPENEWCFTAKFMGFLAKLKKHNWISYYPTLFGLHKSCNGVSRKISFSNKLKFGLEVYLKNEEMIDEKFGKYLEDAKEYFFNLKI